MERHGTKFIRGSVPNNIELTEDNRRKVTWLITKEDGTTEEFTDVFDTVMLAIGRNSDTKKIGLEDVGVKLKSNGKIICNDDDVKDFEEISFSWFSENAFPSRQLVLKAFSLLVIALRSVQS